MAAPKTHREQVLPLNVHLWRGRTWKQISKLESRQGDTVRAIRRIRESLQWYKNKSAIKVMSETEKQKRAQNFMYFVAELADETAKRQDEFGMGEPWNTVYVKTMLHFWKEIPNDLRHEIIRLSPKRNKAG